MPELLEIDHLDKSFFATHAVKDVSFTVGKGEIVSLLGENGAGKSTVIKLLAGVHKPDAGTMSLNGTNIETGSTRSRISFIHQNLGLIEWMSVAENIAQTLGYPRRGGFISRRALNRQAEQVLSLVGGGVDPEMRIFELPRTERSLLAIARGLVTEPELLVLDEPTASLPANDVERLFAVLRRLRDEGVGMIYVSHRLDEIYEISTRTVIMRNGAVVGNREVSGLPHRELVDLIVGHHAVNPTFDPPREQVRLSLRDVSIDDVGPVDIEVRQGEVLALCGLRGSGQERVGRAIGGAERITGGQALLDGAPYAPRNPADGIAQGVGFVTSNRETEAVAAGLSVRENLFLNPSVWGRRRFQFETPKPERARAQKHIDAFGVRPRDPELPLDTFSGGNQQKIILARWLGLGRKLVVLEEPTMGVDVGAKADIYTILSDAAAEGTSAVVVSTDMEEVAAIAHRALVFGRGRIVAEFSGSELTINNLIAAASDLERAVDADPIPPTTGATAASTPAGATSSTSTTSPSSTTSSSTTPSSPNSSSTAAEGTPA